MAQATGLEKRDLDDAFDTRRRDHQPARTPFAHRADRLSDSVVRNAEPPEDSKRGAGLDAQQAEQYVLGADVSHAHLLGFFLSPHERQLAVLGEPLKRILVGGAQLNGAVARSKRSSLTTNACL